MLVRKLRAEDFIALIDRIISRYPDHGFTRKLDRLIYSGPERKTSAQLKTDFARLGIAYCSNEDRAREEAAETGAVRIDGTFIGRLLLKLNLRTYFLSVYKDPDEAEKSSFRVWAYTSQKFLEYGEGVISSVASAADPRRVMGAVEIPAIAKNLKYQKANEQPLDYLRTPMPPSREASVRWFALIELRKWQKAARREKSQKFHQRFLERLETYRVGRQLELRGTAKDGRAIYQYTAEERFSQNQQSVIRFAVRNMQPIQAAIEYEEKTGFRPYSAASNSRIMTAHL